MAILKAGLRTVSVLVATVGLAVTSSLLAAPAASAAIPQQPDDGATAQATERAVRCAQAAKAAGWTGEDLVISVAVSLAESECTPGAQNHVGPTDGCPNGSIDRGAWQINNCYHDWVSDECAYDVSCNAESAYTIYGWAGGFTPWVTYNEGLHLRYMAEARDGVTAIGGGGGGGGGAVTGTVTTTGGDRLTVRSGPSSSDDAVGSLANGDTVFIECQVHGEAVYSEVYGTTTTLWNRIGTGQYVSDGYVYTGSDGQVAPSC